MLPFSIWLNVDYDIWGIFKNVKCLRGSWRPYARGLVIYMNVQILSIRTGRKHCWECLLEEAGACWMLVPSCGPHQNPSLLHDVWFPREKVIIRVQPIKPVIHQIPSRALKHRKFQSLVAMAHEPSTPWVRLFQNYCKVVQSNEKVMKTISCLWLECCLNLHACYHVDWPPSLGV